MNSINIINILGVYPPPLGGVSIHVKRLIHGLNKYRLIFLINYGSKVKGFEYIENIHSLPFYIFFLYCGREEGLYMFIQIHM